MNELRTGLAAFMAGVLLVYLILSWRTVRPINRLVLIVFVIIVNTSALARLFAFKAGVTLSPWWLAPALDIGYIVMASLLIVSIWLRIKYKQQG